MDDKHPHEDEPSVTSHGRSGVSLSRRRFTRAGLSGTVVLGSLASKPVLGAVPYHCTVSGQVSGNLSRAAEAGECLRLGESLDFWKTADPWPGVFQKGTLSNATNCNFSKELIAGTSFNACTSARAFFTKTGGSDCTIFIISGTTDSTAATMMQVLSTTDTSEQFVLGRAVVASLLNAEKYQLDYPVTTQTIIAMFRATFDGGVYFPVGGKAPEWDRGRVIDYLESLYPPS